MTPFDRRFAAALFLTLLCVYLLTGSGHFYASDDLQKLRLIESLWRDGVFTIQEGWAQGLHHGSYSWFPLGASVVMVPGWALGHLAVAAFPMLPAEYVVRFAVSVQNAFFSAGLVAMAYGFARRLGAPMNGAGWMAVALGLGTMIWPYAKTSWSEPAAMVLLLGGLWALWEASAAAVRRPVLGWAAGGLALGAAAFIRQEVALVALGAAAWLVWRHRPRWRAIAACLGAPLLAVGLISLWYNQVRYGDPFTFMNYRVPQENLVMAEGRFVWSLHNLYQYLLSPNQGIVWYSPAVLVGLAGLKKMPRAAVTLFACALGPLAMFFVFGWGVSSWSWGLRYNYFFVPFLMLGAAWALPATARGRAVAAGVLATGVAVQLLAIVPDYNRLYEDVLAAHRAERLSIKRLVVTPSYAGLALAWQALPATLENGLTLLTTSDTRPSTTLREYRERRRHLPDFWFVLQLLSPLPRKLTLAVAALMAIATAASAFWLACVWRAAPEDGSPEFHVDSDAERAERLGDHGEVLT